MANTFDSGSSHNSTVVIADLSALRALAARRRPLVPRHQDKLLLTCPWLTEQEAACFGGQLTRATYDCGCGVGVFTVIIAVAVYVLFLLSRPGGLWRLGWEEIIGFVVVFVGSVAIGKAWGLRRARRRIVRLIRELEGLASKRMRRAIESWNDGAALPSD